MKVIRFVLFSLGVLASAAASAEQGCSDGFYPGGSQPGGQICIPIPGQRSTSGGNQAPAEQWQDRWGAIAMDVGGKTGVGINAPSKRQAEREAVKQCKDKGGPDCKVEISYRNSCGALAWGDGFMTTARADTLSEASRMALDGCAKASPQCEIFFSNCSFPERIH